PDGTLEVEAVTGWYDVEHKRGVETHHVQARAVPIANGLFLAFRTSCAACSPGWRERLHVVGPGSVGAADGDASGQPTAGAAVAHASLPLEVGTAGGVVISSSAPTVAEWRRRVGVRVADLPAPMARFGFLASHTSAD